MRSELPPAVTIKSSKRALWEEIKVMQEEIDTQQATVNMLRDERDALRNRANMLDWQLRMVREVLSATAG